MPPQDLSTALYASDHKYQRESLDHLAKCALVLQSCFHVVVRFDITSSPGFAASMAAASCCRLCGIVNKRVSARNSFKDTTITRQASVSVEGLSVCLFVSVCLPGCVLECAFSPPPLPHMHQPTFSPYLLTSADELDPLQEAVDKHQEHIVNEGKLVRTRERSGVSKEDPTCCCCCCCCCCWKTRQLS